MQGRFLGFQVDSVQEAKLGAETREGKECWDFVREVDEKSRCKTIDNCIEAWAREDLRGFSD
jgi:hypothetical protein